MFRHKIGYTNQNADHWGYHPLPAFDKLRFYQDTYKTAFEQVIFAHLCSVGTPDSRWRGTGPSSGPLPTLITDTSQRMLNASVKGLERGQYTFRHIGRQLSIIQGAFCMNRTGTKCTQSGIYRADCVHRTQIALSKGDTFPPCQREGHAVVWILVRATQ